LSYFTAGNRICENPAVTTCFDLHRPSSARTTADTVSLREHWSGLATYIPNLGELTNSLKYFSNFLT